MGAGARYDDTKRAMTLLGAGARYDDTKRAMTLLGAGARYDDTKRAMTVKSHASTLCVVKASTNYFFIWID